MSREPCLLRTNQGGFQEMILNIELPHTNMAIENAAVVEWHKQVGDAVTFGDSLVDLAVDKVTRLRRQSAQKVLGASRRREARYFAVKGGGFRIRVSSMESGVLTAISAPQGESVTTGSLLGTIDSQDDNGAGSSPPETEAVARVVVNRVDEGEDLSS